MRIPWMSSVCLWVVILANAIHPLPLPPAAEAESPDASACEQFAEKFRNPQSLPFSFRYDGKSSAELMPSWSIRQESIQRPDNSEEWRIYLTDPHTGLQIRCEIVQFADVPVIEWLLHFRNDGKADTPVIEDIQAADVTFPSQTKEPVLHYARGAVCSMNDYQPIRRVLNKGAKMLVQPGGGRSSSDYLPFFNLETSTRSGIILSIGWSGEWAARFDCDQNKSVRMAAGTALAHLKLYPGEEIRTPKIALLFYRGDWIAGQNLQRRFILAHHRPIAKGKPLESPILNGNWGGTSAADHLRNIDAIIKHDLPIDYYWIDAEWFGIGKWHINPGDWRVKKDLYPQGFKPISDMLHQSGRKLLLWFEPERVCEGTPWYSEHADWLLTVPKERRFYNWGNSQHEPDWVQWESQRNQIKENDRLFNLANPAARRFLTDYMSRCIDEFGIDCYRHDANIAPMEFWRAADAVDRQGITEIRWIEGLYAFWDELLQRHPGLIIDNCASGGRRIDLESLGRSTPFWRTDHPEDAVGKQCHTYGLSFWVPLNATGAVTLGKDSDYVFRSTISSSVVIGLATDDDASLSQAKKTLQQYRDVQKLYLGDYYPLTCYSQANDAWMAWQFDHPDLGEGLVQVFRRSESISTSGVLQLHGLDSLAVYTITNLDMGTSHEQSGHSLMRDGLTIALAEKPAAAMLTYRRK